MSTIEQSAQEWQAVKDHPKVFDIYRAYCRLEKVAGSNKHYQARCPFHADKTASFRLDLDYHGRWEFYCFGCEAAGAIIEFVMARDGVTNGEALRTLKQELNFTAEEHAKLAAARPHIERAPEPEKVYITDPLDSKLVAKLEYDLFLNAPALKYLTARGLSEDTIRTFHLGYLQTNPYWSQTREDSRIEKGKEAIKDKGWIAIPYISGDKVTLWKFRSLVAKEFCRKPNMASGLYNVDAIAASIEAAKRLYIVSGEFDCMALSQNGHFAVSLNADKFIPKESEILLLKAAQVVLAGDNDDHKHKYATET